MEKENTKERKILSFLGVQRGPNGKDADELPPLAESELQEKFKNLKTKYGDLLSENADLCEKIEELENLIGSLLRTLILLAAQDEHIEIREKLLELQESMREGVNIDEMKRIGSELKDLILRIEPMGPPSKSESSEVELEYLRKTFNKVEQSLQNILLLLSRDIAILAKVNDEKLAKKVSKFVKFLERKFSAKDVEKICYHFNMLYEDYRQTVREERQKLEELLKTIFENLIETQEEFLRSLSENHEWLEKTSKDHDQSMIQKTKDMEKVCSQSTSIGDLKENLLDKINEIRNLIHVKKELDQKQLDKYINEELQLRRQLKEAKKQKKSYFEELLAIKEKSLEDPLTGAYNREAYRIKIQESLNSEKSFVLMILDIDDFKEINDKFGHKIGDNVLQRVIYYVKKQVRGTDLLARYGGDEFVIIMENAALANGEKKAQNILRSLSKVEFHLDKTSRKILTITMSIGVAQRRQNDTTESLFERADKAMYLAKINGKNQYRSEKDLSS